MPAPRLKTIITSSFVILFFSFLLFFINTAIYDQNSFLNPLENKFLHFFNTKFENQNIKNDDLILFNFDKKIKSRNFINLLYFLNEASVDKIILDVNFSNLLDQEKYPEIKEQMKKDNIYGFFYIDKMEKSPIKDKLVESLLVNNSIILNTTDDLSFSHHNGKKNLKNDMLISPEKIGFIDNKNNLFDKNNFNLLLKANSKYILSLPFLLKIYDEKKDPKKIILNNYKTETLFKNYYYDQKGKSGFILSEQSKFNYNEYNFNEWENILNIREEILNILKELNLYNLKNSGYYLYLDENTLLNNIYNLAEIKDFDKNNKLSKAKDYTTKWKSFKTSYIDKLNNKQIFITQNDDKNIVKNFIAQNILLYNGINLKRISLYYIFSLSFFIFFLAFFAGYLLNNKILFLPALILYSMVLLCLYVIFRLYYKYDFPFTALLSAFITGVIPGLSINLLNNYFWIKEVRSIYKGSISKKFTKEISIFWRKKRWDIESKSKLCTFMLIDTSSFLQKDITENDLDMIGKKNTEFEAIIKNNRGIRNNFTSKEISAYFGNPEILTEHAQAAVKTALAINGLSNTENSKVISALHSKEEWFKYVKRGNQKMYTYFGNSITILSAMIQYAKKFNLSIVISETVYKLCNLSLPVRMLDRIKINGILQTFRLFELLTDAEYSDNKNFYDYFHAGLKLYENKKWKESSSYFRQCLKIKEKDITSKIYLDRCKKNSSELKNEDAELIYLID